MDQTIGITEWRDIARNSTYPFEESCGVPALFLDATFIQFDGFIPKLNKVTVNSSSVQFSFQLDTGEYIHSQPESGCVEGAVIVLRSESSDRYHGQIVLGPGIIYALNNLKGVVLEPDLEFSALTVRAIPRTSGLFAIDQAYNDIEVKLDHSQFFNVSGNRVVWNSVSLPSNIPEVRLLSKNLYAITDKKHMVELDLEAHTMKKMFTLSNPMTAVVTSEGKLLGANENQYFELNAVPATKLQETADNISVMTTGYDDKSLLFGVTGNSLLGIDPYDGDANSSVGFLSGGTRTLACYEGNDQFVYTIKGPFDRNTNSTVSDILYKSDGVTNTIVGLVTINGDMHQPPCVGLIKMPDDDANTVTGVLANASVIKVVKIDLLLGTATLVFSIATSTTFGNLVSVTDGKNVRVTLRSVTPLKSVNGVSPINNAIHFIDKGIIHLERTGADQITVNLAPEAERTIIKRSTKYEV